MSQTRENAYLTGLSFDSSLWGGNDDGVSSTGGKARADDGVSSTGGKARADDGVSSTGGKARADDGVSSTGGKARADDSVSSTGGKDPADDIRGKAPAAEQDTPSTVVGPQKMLYKIQEATGDNKIAQDVVRKEVECKTPPDFDNRSRYAVLCLVSAIWDAYNKTNDETIPTLTVGQIVAAAVRCVPSDAKALAHFRAFVNKGEIQRGEWDSTKMLASLLQTLVELGLAKADKERPEPSLFRYEKYKFQYMDFWKALVPRLYSEGLDVTRKFEIPQALFNSNASIYSAKLINGYSTDVSQRAAKGTLQDTAAAKKTSSLASPGWVWNGERAENNAFRFTDNRTKPQGAPEAGVAIDRLNHPNPTSRTKFLLPDSYVSSATVKNRARLQMKSEAMVGVFTEFDNVKNENAALRTEVADLRTELETVNAQNIMLMLEVIRLTTNATGAAAVVAPAGESAQSEAAVVEPAAVVFESADVVLRRSKRRQPEAAPAGEQSAAAPAYKKVRIFLPA